MTWNFYYCGILYGKISEEEEGLFVQMLDWETGRYEEEKLFTKEEDEFFHTLSSHYLLDFFSSREKWEGLIKDEPAEFKTAAGDVFTKRGVLSSARYPKCGEELEGSDYSKQQRYGSYIQRVKKFPKDLFYKDGDIYAVYMPARESMAVLVKEGWEEETVLSAWKDVYGENWNGEKYNVQIEYGENSLQNEPKNKVLTTQDCISGINFFGTFWVKTRDGESLATDVYLPVKKCGDEKYPVVLVRTPYQRKDTVERYYSFVQRGYAVVVQDVRGREDSTGEWVSMHYELEDGDDTLNWIGAQDWCDGNVGMTGGSYLGYVQWAAAASGNPYLKAMLSSVTAGSAFVDLPRPGGCMASGSLAWEFMMSKKHMDESLMNQDNWDEILDYRPLETLPKRALGYSVPFIEEEFRHDNMDDFWRMTSWKDRYQGRPVPALIMSGWFDDNGMGTTEALDLVRNWPEGTWKTVLGAWMHSGNANYDIHGVYMGEDALRYDMDIQKMKWLEHFLKGVDNGIEKTPTVEYYSLGENEWKTADVWPPEFTKEVIYYFGGEDVDCARGTGRECGQGLLVPEDGLYECILEDENTVEEHECEEGKVLGDRNCAKEEPQNLLTDLEKESQKNYSDSYFYDPQNPSTHIIDMSENEIQVPEDYTEEECRTDILTYSTSVLTEPIIVTGDMEATIFISCDCPDTDLFVRVNDVDEKGKSIKLADGVMGVKYRNSFETPEYMEPGNIYEVKIRTSKISNCFLPGHKIRVTVTSSAKNAIFPNSNTEKGFNSEETRVAKVTIHRDREHASCIKMPVEKK